MLMGGGFGRRGNRDVEFIVDSVLLSKAARRPVKVIWTREDDVHNGRFRPLSVHILRAELIPMETRLFGIIAMRLTTPASSKIR